MLDRPQQKAMKVAVTIPQIFYDLIARVVPGFLFLLALNFQLSATGVEVIQLPTSSSNSIALVLYALVYGILSYLMGWVLLAFTFGSLRDRIKEKLKSELNLEEDSISISEMYQRVRIKDEAVGFRIVKLRAEARMLETSRTGMLYISAILLGLLAISKLALIPSPDWSRLTWGIRLCVPIVLAVAFRKLERRAWNNYFGNIIINYEILFETRVRKKPELAPGKDVGSD